MGSQQTLSRLFLIFTISFILYKLLLPHPKPSIIQSISENSTHDAIITAKSCINEQSILSTLPSVISSHDYNTWHLDVNLCNHTFSHLSPSLLVKTFTNKSMIFFGDSTMYRFYIFVVWCLDQYIHSNISKACQFDGSLLNTNYDEWNEYLFSPYNETDPDLELIPTIPIDNLHRLKSEEWTISYRYYHIALNINLYLFENQRERNIYQLYELYESWIKYKPNIIFYNPFGLHLLHLFPMRPFQFNALGIINKYHENLEKIHEISQKMNATLIYRGISPICYSFDQLRYYMLRGQYEQWFRDGQKPGNRKVIGCSMEIEDRLNYADEYQDFDFMHDIINGDNLDFMEICANWTFMNNGVLHQNGIIQRFVQGLQEDGDRNVWFYDRYKIFHSDLATCKQEAKDSVHWQPTYSADLMYLTNFINFVI